MMLGHAPQQPPFPETTAFDVTSFQSLLRFKLAQLTGTHMTEAAHKQKLDSKQKGDQDVRAVKGLTTYSIPFLNISV